MHNQKGFTLIELVIAIFIAMMALASGYMVFFSTTRASTAQTNVSRMQDNARIAMDVLARRFRGAGFLVDFFSYPAGTQIPDTPALGITQLSQRLLHVNNTGTSDQVTFVGASGNCSSTLAQTAVAGANTLILQNASCFSGVPGDIIGIGLHYTARVNAIAGNVLTLDNSVPRGTLPMKFPGTVAEDGTTPSLQTPATVTQLQTSTFDIITDAISGRPVLRLNNQVIAEDIEDIQIQYGIDTSNDGMISGTLIPATGEWANVPAVINIDQIRIVTITIVARTAQEDPTLRGVNRTLPAYGDRIPNPRVVADGFRRMVLTRTIHCRNMDPVLVL